MCIGAMYNCGPEYESGHRIGPGCVLQPGIYIGCDIDKI